MDLGPAFLRSPTKSLYDISTFTSLQAAVSAETKRSLRYVALRYKIFRVPKTVEHRKDTIFVQ
jgi:hypothetical protein